VGQGKPEKGGGLGSRELTKRRRETKKATEKRDVSRAHETNSGEVLFGNEKKKKKEQNNPIGPNNKTWAKEVPTLPKKLGGEQGTIQLTGMNPTDLNGPIGWEKKTFTRKRNICSAGRERWWRKMTPPKQKKKKVQIKPER